MELSPLPGLESKSPKRVRRRDRAIPGTKSPLYRAVTSRGLRAPIGILDPGSDLAERATYDQILVSPKFPASVTGKGGVVDVWSGSYRPLYEGISRKNNAQLTREMSDHLPLWIELSTDGDQGLSQWLDRHPRRVTV